MPFTTLISPETLAQHLDDPTWVVVDCRFSLADTEAGRRAYRQAHIPGAVYAHLDEDLSGPPVTDHGRHPLPAPEALQALFGRLGIDEGTQVVAYDDVGSIVAARLWWMLRYMGHEAAAVLDGGWTAWEEAGHPTAAGMEKNEPVSFDGAPRREWLVVAEEVAEKEASGQLIDARTPERFRGEEEPLDPVAGRIPGAVNYPYGRNLDEDGRFLPAEDLRQQVEAVLKGSDPEAAVHYCGSGVSACQNLLAQAHVGLPPGRLYAGSWSDWITDPERPVATSSSEQD
ncbi:MAG: sulfurtransferase [Candidatus Promineifilaceae bacterium]|nr:sulfurtransferase [Candidatus Promineifilaceae bacterium]